MNGRVSFNAQNAKTLTRNTKRISHRNPGCFSDFDLYYTFAQRVAYALSISWSHDSKFKARIDRENRLRYFCFGPVL